MQNMLCCAASADRSITAAVALIGLKNFKTVMEYSEAGHVADKHCSRSIVHRLSCTLPGTVMYLSMQQTLEEPLINCVVAMYYLGRLGTHLNCSMGIPLSG